MSNKERGDKLENYVLSLLRDYDMSCRRTIGSGAGKQKGDIYSPKFNLKIECKYRSNKNCIIENKHWTKLLNELNTYKPEIPVLALQNNNKDIFVVLNIKDFIHLLSNINTK